MKDTVTLKELAAIVIRKGKTIVSLALVFALLLGGYRLSQKLSDMNGPGNTPERIEQRYQQAMERYEREKETLELELEQLVHRLETEQEYLDESLLLKIDPYNKAVTIILLSITDFEEASFQQVYQIQGTPVDYIVSRIQNQYLVRWSSANLQEELNAEIKDRFLREVVSVEAKSGGLLRIKAYGETEEDSAALAKAAYAFLTEGTEVVSQSAYPHQFSLLSESTRVVVDSEMESTRSDVVDKIADDTKAIDELQKKIAKLQEPAREQQITVMTAAVASVKYAILGGVLGAFAAVVWVMVCYLFSNRLSFSWNLEQLLEAPMMTALPMKKDIWNKIANRILGERIWKTEEQALVYLKESAALRLNPGEKVVLLTTLREKESQRAARYLTDTLKEKGYDVRFVSDACYNGEALNALAGCDGVIVAERCDRSGMEAISTEISLIKEQNKPIKGYILI